MQLRLQLLRCLKHLFLLEKETIIAFISVLKIYDKHRWLQLCCRFFFKQKKHIKIHQSKTTKYIPEKANFTTAKKQPPQQKYYWRDRIWAAAKRNPTNKAEKAKQYVETTKVNSIVHSSRIEFCAKSPEPTRKKGNQADD